MGDVTEQRVCERATLRRPVEVIADDGRVFPGVLINVSLGGMLVEVARGESGFARGQAIDLRLDPASEVAAYRCTVQRAGDDLLGLSLDRKLAAKFGLAVTRGMFSAGRDAAGANGA